VPLCAPASAQDRQGSPVSAGLLFMPASDTACPSAGVTTMPASNGADCLWHSPTPSTLGCGQAHPNQLQRRSAAVVTHRHAPVRRQFPRDVFRVEPATADVLPTGDLAGLWRTDHSQQRQPPSAGRHVRDGAERRIPPCVAKLDTTNARSEIGCREAIVLRPLEEGSALPSAGNSFYEPNYESRP